MAYHFPVSFEACLLPAVISAQIVSRTLENRAFSADHLILHLTVRDEESCGANFSKVCNRGGSILWLL